MHDTKKARDELKDILNQKEYTVYYNDSNSLLGTLWEKAKAWIADKLAKLFPSIESASSASGPILIAIIVAVIILLALSTFLIIRNQRRNRVLRKQNPLQSMKEIKWSFQKHLAEAEKLEAIEEYTQSTRHMFLALLLYFHEKGWLEARIWKTNWEYYDELRRVNQQCADQFYDLASFFDEVTYGETSVQREAYLQFRNGVIKWLEETDPLLERNGERG